MYRMYIYRPGGAVCTTDLNGLRWIQYSEVPDPTFALLLLHNCEDRDHSKLARFLCLIQDCRQGNKIAGIDACG